jgi:hypothetical protein
VSITGKVPGEQLCWSEPWMRFSARTARSGRARENRTGQSVRRPRRRGSQRPKPRVGDMCRRSAGGRGTRAVACPHTVPRKRRTAPSIGPARVRRPLQPAPAAPVPPATTARPQRPIQRSAELAGSTAESARRRDQRVLPGSVADLINPQVTRHATGFEAVQAEPSVDTVPGKRAWTLGIPER